MSIVDPIFREYTYDDHGNMVQMKINFHSGQQMALMSTARYILVLSGAQGGKTALTPHWLHNEIFGWEDKGLGVKIVGRGPGDYLMVSASFPLMNNNLLPSFREVFETYYRLGSYSESKKIFESYEKLHGSPYFRVIFGTAANPESIESATAKAAVLDEAGQDQFSLQSWEAIERRVARNLGRVLITTTIYNLGWLKMKLYDKWIDGDKNIDVIQFPSFSNPSFSKEEFERLRATMPDWKFKMFYEGKYSKPAGLIYDSFDESVCLVDRFPLPKEWPRYVGHDFGPTNTVALWYAQDPGTGYFYAYREYIAGDRSAVEHAEVWKELSAGENIIKRTGGSQNEDGWRQSFSYVGWPITKPVVKNVEVGIDRVYGLHKTNKLFVFRDLEHYLDQKHSYQWKLDEKYDPTGVIDNKSSFHFMDAERYILSEFQPDVPHPGMDNRDKIRVKVW